MLDSKENGIQQRPLNVFLCHSSKDKPVVRELYKRLHAEGINVWLDEENLLPGQDWEQEIAKSVRKSDIVLVCLSQNATARSGYVHKEIKYALDVADEQPEGIIYLIPLKLEECEVPNRLSRLQWVNMFEEGGFARLIRALNERAKTLVNIQVALEPTESESIQKKKKERDTIIHKEADIAQLLATHRLLLVESDVSRIPGPRFPPTGIFEAKKGALERDQYKFRNAVRQIEETLHDFGFPAKVIEVNQGYSYTQFGIEPGFIEQRAPSGKVSRIKVPMHKIIPLEDDLKLVLAAKSIRIETPVPGRSIIGIDVPNEPAERPVIRQAIEDQAYKDSPLQLKIVLGYGLEESPVISDLATLPHLLVSGITTAGKSTFVKTIATCLILNCAPDIVRLIIVNPKRDETAPFDTSPHLLGTIISETGEMSQMLRWLIIEMEKRSLTLDEEQSRNIAAYNEKMEKSRTPKMPNIVVIIDDLENITIPNPMQFGNLLTRLLQKAHLAGIHLVVCTGEPSAKCLKGLLQVGYFARIAFRMLRGIDSSVVINSPDAIKLLGRGDMLYRQNNTSNLVRLQSCWISDDEIFRLVQFWTARTHLYKPSFIGDAPWKEQVP